jgi:ribosome-binding factor A
VRLHRFGARAQEAPLPSTPKHQPLHLPAQPNNALRPNVSPPKLPLMSNSDRESSASAPDQSDGAPAPTGQSRQAEPSGCDPDELQQLVGEVGPGDGADPRYDPKRRRRTAGHLWGGQGHGDSPQDRFGAQVQEAIDCALQSAVTPILNSLTVIDVVKQGGSLVVVVGPRIPSDPLDLKSAATALEQAASMLRSEVASAITRKEVPHLSFIVLPAGAQKIDDSDGDGHLT